MVGYNLTLDGVGFPTSTSVMFNLSSESMSFDVLIEGVVSVDIVRDRQ
jgi:hypothetical protein